MSRFDRGSVGHNHGLRRGSDLNQDDPAVFPALSDVSRDFASTARRCWPLAAISCEPLAFPHSRFLEVVLDVDPSVKIDLAVRDSQIIPLSPFPTRLSGNRIMSGLLDLVGQYLNNDSVDTISKTIGADPQQTQQAIGAALPTLLGAITRNATEPGGEASLHNALSNDHDGSILDHLGSLFGGQAPAAPQVSERTTAGGSILDHILGTRRSRVEEGVSRASGLSSGQTMKLLAISS